MKLAQAVPLAVLAAAATLLASSMLLSSTGSTTHYTASFFSGSEPTHAADWPPPPPPPGPQVQLNGIESTVTTAPVPRSSNIVPEARHREAAVDYSGSFLVAEHVIPPSGDEAYALKLMKTLIGIAHLLGRTLVLPAALCRCDDTAALSGCSGDVVSIFDCPLADTAFGRAMREAVNVGEWAGTHYVSFRPAAFLSGRLPDELACSRVRVLLPDGMDAGELGYALRSYKDTRVLEVSRAAEAFCGWDVRLPGNPERQRDFDATAERLLGHGATTHSCTHYRGGTGEVLQFSDLKAAHCKRSERPTMSRLPESIASLPRGSDLMVTFATGSVAIMAANWVAAARKTGMQDVLVGALDDSMMVACAQQGLPCVRIEGGEVTKALKAFNGNLRDRADLYPKMSVLKVGFYRELLFLGYNVWACDADAVFISDPRPMMREWPWTLADMAVATDCIDIPSDSRYPLTHCDYNTGLVYMRARPEVFNFTERWRETIAIAKEKRIRDQAAFNMLTKQSRPTQLRVEGDKVAPRVLLSTDGADGKVKLGLLPLSRYLNGHTYFVQHAHTLPDAPPPISVHMTYQFAEGRTFAHGKRQRLRQAGLWYVDEDSYYNGRYVMVSPSAATLPEKSMGPQIDSREAVKYHLDESRHRLRLLRSLLGVAKALGREVILPRMLCYCDFMWKEMEHCRVGGAETMRLPFECPMDHVLNTPNFFENNNVGVSVRESNFLSNPRVPRNVSANIAKVTLSKGLDDREVIRALEPYRDAGVIELSDADGLFCGFADSQADASFKQTSNELLTYHRLPFCTIEGSNNAPMFSQCCSPRKPGDKFFPCMHGFDPPEALPRCAHPSSLVQAG